MSRMYLFGGIALLAAGVVYFFASKTVGEFLLFVMILGFWVLELVFWASWRREAMDSEPAESTTTGEPHAVITPSSSSRRHADTITPGKPG
jgi:hypothetical protein